MIVKPPPSCFELFMVCSRGSIIQAIYPKIVLACAVGLLAAVVNDRRLVGQHHAPDFNGFAQPFSALGIAISLYLGFRNNAGYERWHEARMQLGGQLIAVRSLARAAGYGSNDGRKRLMRLATAHVVALRFQLRGDDVPLPHINVEPQDAAHLATQQNVADALLRLCSEVLEKAYVDPTNQVDSIVLVAVNTQLEALGAVQGACERIASTPLPYVYNLLVHRSTYLYIILAPFAMATTLSYFTVVFNAATAYVFFGLDEVTQQLEHPFAPGDHCVALEAITRNIQVSVAEALGEHPPPQLIPTKDGLLM